MRPARLLPGVTSPLRGIRPGDIDWIVVRENTEGEYAGAGGGCIAACPRRSAPNSPCSPAPAVRASCALPSRWRARAPRRLTLVTKSNAQRHGMVLWDETFAELAREFPEVTTDKELVDAMTTRMVLQARDVGRDRRDQPARRHPVRPGQRPLRIARPRPDRQSRSRAALPFDVRADPRLGFDITGKGIANPIASFWSAVLMLEHLGEHGAASHLWARSSAPLRPGDALTPDLNGSATTADVTARVCDLLSGANL